MFMFMYSEPKNKGVVLIITQIETNFDNIMWRVQVSTSGLSFHSVRYCVNPIGTSSCFSYTRRTAPLSFPHCLFLWRCQTKVSTTYDFFKKNDLTPLFAARTICLAHSTHVNTLSSYPTHPFSCFLVLRLFSFIFPIPQKTRKWLCPIKAKQQYLVRGIVCVVYFED